MEWGPNTVDESRDFIRMTIALQKDNPRRHFDLAIVKKAENLSLIHIWEDMRVLIRGQIGSGVG